jgi:hypothetical protein
MFLSNLLSRKKIELIDCKKGISVDDLPLSTNTVVLRAEMKKILVVPPGLNKDLVRRFADFGAVVADHLDPNYPEDSTEVFVKTVESVKPQMVVCGSRGTRLLECCMCHIDMIVLFSPTRLREFFESRPTSTTTSRVVLIHGVHDPNEHIGFVRQLVEQEQATNKNTHLVEVDDNHSLSSINQTDRFEKILNYCVNYYY